VHVVIGAGPVGTAIARRLAEQGTAVRLITRSGTGPEHPAIERLALDAADAPALAQATRGAAVIYNAASPANYATWAKAWPPLADAMLRAAKASGSTLATVGNLYGYGPVEGPITESMPLASTERKGMLRARMWRDALAAHEAGDLRAVEVRASDYIGVGGMSHSARVAALLAAGKRVSVIGSPDQPHTWTSSRDTAHLLVAAAADPGAQGRAWHVPSNPPRTQRELAHDLAEAAGLPTPKVSGTPHWVVATVGVAVPQMREIARLRYEFDRPFVLDDTDARARFGLRPTPWGELTREVMAAALQTVKTAPGSRTQPSSAR
jgi:nucleoside-diphosphate-sugar epimerase